MNLDYPNLFVALELSRLAFSTLVSLCTVCCVFRSAKDIYQPLEILFFYTKRSYFYVKPRPLLQFRVRAMDGCTCRWLAPA